MSYVTHNSAGNGCARNEFYPPSSILSLSLSLSLSLQYLFYNEQQLQIMRLATTERELKISAMEIIYQGIHREEIYERV